MRDEIMAAIEIIRPALQLDGGDLKVINIDEQEGILEIELLGACGGCSLSAVTMTAGIERILKSKVPALKEIRAINSEPDPYKEPGGFESPFQKKNKKIPLRPELDPNWAKNKASS